MDVAPASMSRANSTGRVAKHVTPIYNKQGSSPRRPRQGVKTQHISSVAVTSTVPATCDSILAVQCHSARRRNGLVELSYLHEGEFCAKKTKSAPLETTPSATPLALVTAEISS